MAYAGETYLIAISCDIVKTKNRFFCKLFDDMIVPSLCMLRRKELSGRDHFSCDGCRMLRSIREKETGQSAGPA